MTLRQEMLEARVIAREDMSKENIKMIPTDTDEIKQLTNVINVVTWLLYVLKVEKYDHFSFKLIK
jgi:hypothetical protein